MLESAVAYTRRGWSVIPIPHRHKNPGRTGWQRLRLAEADLAQHFNGRPQNIGVLTGEPSGWLVDVDLDYPRAVELAKDYLPHTTAVFGRSGNPRSHWLYAVTGPLASKKHRSKSAGMIVEVRSTGLQTVIPPSTHETGEPICWEPDAGDPALIDGQELLDAAKALADAVLCELGEKRTPRLHQSVPKAAAQASINETHVDRRARCLTAMLRMHMLDSRDGSARLFAVACRVVEHDLTDLQALDVIAEYARQRPFPKLWTEIEILRRVREAERICTRGDALQIHFDDELIRLGATDPETGKLVLSPKRTLPTAEAFLHQFHAHPEGRTLQFHTDQLLHWNGCRYVAVEDEAVKKLLHTWLHDALRYSARRNAEPELVPFESNPTSVKAALDTLKALTHLPGDIVPPVWLDERPRPLPQETLPCQNMLLHLPTMSRLPCTPAFFATHALEFDPNPDAGPPLRWLAFLHELFDDDLESVELLQEWCGYCLVADTSQQKMLLIIGPRRSGKGTIARILRELVGPSNVCGPTTSSLAGSFGLQPLLNKILAIVSDARFSGENITTVIERLLCISGEDAVSVDRKFLPSVTTRLPTRFMFLSNEMPRLNDSSGALAGRFLILKLTESFYGREDTQLTTTLLEELPGILNWAMEGWQRLRQRGHFVTPASVSDMVQDIEDLSSPVGAFVREHCVVGPGLQASIEALYSAWKRWCDQDGRTLVGTKQTFGRDLAAAVAGVKRRRGTHQPFYAGITLKDVSS